MIRGKRFVCILLMALIGLMGGTGAIGGEVSARATEPKIIQIATGMWHSLALFSNGDLYAWGANGDDGRLGDGTTKDRTRPVKVGTGFTQIAAGGYHTLALKGDTLYSWGTSLETAQNSGETAEIDAPVVIGTGFTQIAAGSGHNLALKGDTLYTWGYDNDYGQLGDGTSGPKAHKSTPVKIGTGYTQIAAGIKNSYALKGDVLYAWGYNGTGQLGDGTTQNRSKPVKIGSGFTAIAAGDCHAMALKGDILYEWGNNGSKVPQQIGTGFTQIAAGFYYSMALKGSELYMWGENWGQYGNGSTTESSTPVKIGTGYTQITRGGESFALTLKTDGLYASGNNEFGQLGDGTKTSRTRPVKVQFPTASDGPTALTLNQTKLDLAKGSAVTLKATITPSNAVDKTVTWESSNSKIATVNNGVVTAKAYGLATITASTSNGITAKCAITVVPTKVAQKKPSVSGGRVTLNWTALNDVQGYKIAYSKNGGDYLTLTDVKIASKNSFTTNSLAKGAYSFKIRAYTKIDGAIKYGKYSDVMSVTIK